MTPTATAATKTAASSPNSLSSTLSLATARHAAAPITSASVERARRVTVNASAARHAATSRSPSQAGDGAGPETSPNQLEATDQVDRDAEREPEELDECARRVGDTGLEVLGRQLSHPDRELAASGRRVTSAASVTTSADASRPSRTSRAAQKLAATAAIGATIGSVRAVRLVRG